MNLEPLIDLATISPCLSIKLCFIKQAIKDIDAHVATHSKKPPELNRAIALLSQCYTALTGEELHRKENEQQRRTIPVTVNAVDR